MFYEDTKSQPERAHAHFTEHAASMRHTEMLQSVHATVWSDMPLGWRMSSNIGTDGTEWVSLVPLDVSSNDLYTTR